MYFESIKYINKLKLPRYSTLINICNSLKNKGYDYKRFQVMAPMYAGELGIDILNKYLQNIFNPADKKKKEIKYGDIIYRENDKVLQLVNIPLMEITFLVFHLDISGNEDKNEQL